MVKYSRDRHGNEVRILTPSERDREDAFKLGCFTGIIVCIASLYAARMLLGELDQPIKKVAMLLIGIVSLWLGYKLRYIVWAVMVIAAIGGAGYLVTMWVIN